MIKKRKKKRKLRLSYLLEEVKQDREKQLQKGQDTLAQDAFIPLLENAINAEREFMAAKRPYDASLKECVAFYDRYEIRNCCLFPEVLWANQPIRFKG